MTRLAPLDPAAMDTDQRHEYESLVRWRKPRPDGTFGGPFDTWLRSPEMSNHLRRFGGFVWERTALDRGLVELAISVAAVHYQSNIEWTAHAPRAVEYGVAQGVLDDVLAGRAPSTDREDVTLVTEISRALLDGKALSQALYDRGVEAFGERGMVELAGTVGYYTLVAFTLRMFEVEPLEGVERPFARPPEA
ncbi:MAG: carboxymuconolactone decarboxylase family protein [Dehalococcoidia bacterium]